MVTRKDIITRACLNFIKEELVKEGFTKRDKNTKPFIKDTSYVDDGDNPCLYESGTVVMYSYDTEYTYDFYYEHKGNRSYIKLLDEKKHGLSLYDMHINCKNGNAKFNIV